MSNPSTLVELLDAAPAERTAVILPEAVSRIPYRG